MKKIITALLSLSLLMLNFQVSAAFSDVSETNIYLQDINFIEQLGVVTGDTFKSEDAMTRGEFAKWLLRSSGFVGETYKPITLKRFADVKLKDNVNGPYIYKLAELGAVDFKSGKKNFFYPEKQITRIDALEWTFLVDGISVPKIFDTTTFQATDIKASSPVAPTIDKAIKLGILAPGRANPTKKLKRGEAAHSIKVAQSASQTFTVTLMPQNVSNMSKNSKFDLMTTAWDKIMNEYLRSNSVDRDALMYGAIEGMVKELGDKYSDFERPGNNTLADTLSGEVEGIGAVIQEKDNEVVVISPIVDSPAEKAGVLPNDVITKVDDKDIKGMNLTDVVKLIKGPKGSSVTLTVRRGTQTISIKITRDIVKVVSVKMKRTADNIAVINLNTFGDNTSNEFAAIAKDIKNNAPRGIVIDLRNNPGGYLNTAVDIGGYFIKSGERITTVKYPTREDPQNSKGTAELSAYKVVVIVNAGSASASEILAGALQDYGIAKVIGEKSFGKGTVQELSNFGDGSALKITIAEWLTPKGRSIDKDGVVPNIEVKLTDEDRKADRDPQLDRALAELRM
ncbi:MAG: S41 family peptidase [Candidatus Gracilibacteria bacterium]